MTAMKEGTRPTMEQGMKKGSPVMDAYDVWETEQRSHRAGAFPTEVLRAIERLLPATAAASAETGCGKSTILFSNISDSHTVFCLDDREYTDTSSVRFYSECPLTKLERIHTVFGATQKTLPLYEHPRMYDVVLIDGPHGWPFPEMEYYSFYPHIAPGGILIVDDCHIPTIGRMADVLADDAMWKLEGFVSCTAIFRRTDAPLFDPTGDGWWEQRYNRRRISPKWEFHLADGLPVDTVSRLHLDARLHGDPVGPLEDIARYPGIPGGASQVRPPVSRRVLQALRRLHRGRG
ncbi:MAG: class I SAM-dependent methyltransferase [Acetobacteraceae bacterium]